MQSHSYDDPSDMSARDGRTCKASRITRDTRALGRASRRNSIPVAVIEHRATLNNGCGASAGSRRRGRKLTDQDSCARADNYSTPLFRNLENKRVASRLSSPRLFQLADPLRGATLATSNLGLFRHHPE